MNDDLEEAMRLVDQIALSEQWGVHQHKKREDLRDYLAPLLRDAKRYRWLRGEVHGPHVPLAQVVWKLHGIRDSGEWTNLYDGDSLDSHIDAAIAKWEQA